MRRTIITALIALTALGGVASADRYRGDHRSDHRYRDRGSVRVDRNQRNQRSHRTYGTTAPRQSYRTNVRTYSRPTYRSVVRPQVRVVRQPIYVQRPVIKYRYYNYYQRPALIVENYPAKPGYIWVAGQWQWNGYEWIWQPGHYQPDPAYDAGGYYDAYGNWVPTYAPGYSY